MKRLNPKHICQVFNTLRLQQLKFNSTEELTNTLKKYWSIALIKAMIREGLFTTVRIKHTLVRTFPSEPIHISKFEKLCKNVYTHKETFSQESLKKQGLIIVKKIENFNIEKFKKENPELYSKYLEVSYEEVTTFLGE